MSPEWSCQENSRTLNKCTLLIPVISNSLQHPNTFRPLQGWIFSAPPPLDTLLPRGCIILFALQTIFTISFQQVPVPNGFEVEVKIARLVTRPAKEPGGEIVVHYGLGCNCCASFSLSFWAGRSTPVALRTSSQLTAAGFEPMTFNTCVPLTPS